MKPLTIEGVRAMLREVQCAVGDPEAAHSLEDAMHRSVLAAIRDGMCDDPAECARIAMLSAELDFPRWCA